MLLILHLLLILRSSHVGIVEILDVPRDCFLESVLATIHCCILLILVAKDLHCHRNRCDYDLDADLAQEIWSLSSDVIVGVFNNPHCETKHLTKKH